MNRVQHLVRRTGERLVGRFPGLFQSFWGRRLIRFVKRRVGLDQPSKVLERSDHFAALLRDRKTGLQHRQNMGVSSAAVEVAAIDASNLEIVVCTAFAGRHDCVKFLADEIIAASDRIGLVLCGSDEEDSKLIESLSRRCPRIGGIFHPNRPLGMKWQAVMDAARAMTDASIYGIVGSDDLPSAKLLRMVQRWAVEPCGEKTSRGLIAPMEWLVWDVGETSTTSPGIFRLNYRLESQFQPIGAGRFYFREALDACDWVLFDVDKNRNLDDLGFAQMLYHERAVQLYSVEDGPLVSLKGDWSQLNPLSAILEATTVDSHEYSFEGASLIREAFAAESIQGLLGSTRAAERPMSLPTDVPAKTE